MRLLSLLLLCLLLIANGQAQAVRLKNLMNADTRSRTLYVGIPNKILISPANAMIRAAGKNCEVSVSNDTLLIMVPQRGAVNFSIETAGGVQDFSYTADPLPDFQLMLEGHSRGTIHLSRFVMGQRFIVVSNGRDYWSKFTVSRFACVVNNQSVVNQGPAPGKALKDAFLRAPRGSMITLTSIVLVNKKNKQKEFIRNNMQFVVE